MVKRQSLREAARGRQADPEAASRIAEKLSGNPADQTTEPSGAPAEMLDLLGMTEAQAAALKTISYNLPAWQGELMRELAAERARQARREGGDARTSASALVREAIEAFAGKWAEELRRRRSR